jgi:hypothetical protein
MASDYPFVFPGSNRAWGMAENAENGCRLLSRLRRFSKIDANTVPGGVELAGKKGRLEDERVSGAREEDLRHQGMSGRGILYVRVPFAGDPLTS